VADTEAFVAPLTHARGVFFTGGRQWRLADAYLKTRTHKELEALLARGGVIGGSSAGATILGSFLVRGDTKGNELMIGDHVEGMAFLKNSAIDQHVLRRNRQFDLVEVMKKYPEVLGIGIDEDTAIVVEGDRFEVIGQSYVLVHDKDTAISPHGSFFFMAPGDRFDLVTREASRRQTADRALEHVKQKP
jgi:cyanophycinase